MGRFIWRLFTLIVVGGIVVALLKAFDWNPVALGVWMFEQLKAGVEAVANFFAHNSMFQAATKHK